MQSFFKLVDKFYYTVEGPSIGHDMSDEGNSTGPLQNEEQEDRKPEMPTEEEEKSPGSPSKGKNPEHISLKVNILKHYMYIGGC